jgi:peptidoglycan/xylan/chitin deacetylase (PgdA/CDA1 family)
MRDYLFKTPWLLKKIFPSYTWSIDGTDNIIYLSFDDGPHPVATPFVLDLLKKYNAKATFFCIGKNVVEYPALYQRILAEGHAVGNHTHDHLNGWKTNDSDYLENISTAASHIDSNLFRPPYGRIRRSQAREIREMKIIMWDVLSGDFDTSLTGDQCFRNVVKNTVPGSIIVFHDSEKAWPRVQFFLPEMMKFFAGKGYRFEVIKSS